MLEGRFLCTWMLLGTAKDSQLLLRAGRHHLQPGLEGAQSTLQKITKAGTAPQLAGKAQKCRDRSRGFETSGCWRNRIEVK